MKTCTVNAFQKLANLTRSKCETCPNTPVHRCCELVFCKMVEQDFPKGVTYDKPSVGGIPFMSEKGCVVAPEHRPFCTGFVCFEHFADRGFRREYDRTVSTIQADKDAPLLPKSQLAEKAIRGAFI
jgi:hypothetical protein